MEKFKSANVVMLPTNEKAPIAKFNNTLYNTKKNKDYSDCVYQHLYITTDEPLKRDDLATNGKHIVIWCDDYIGESYRKIITSTDEELKLPKPSQQFIEKYIEQYNINKPITEVLVEYVDNGFEDWIGDDYNGEPFWIEIIEPKINQKDNTITIKRIKNTFTREEMLELCENAYDSGRYAIINKDVDNTWESWKSKNI